MNVLTRNIVNTINRYFISHVSLKHIHLFRFGLITISLPNFQSLNSNARIWGGSDNRSTAESKMYRLLKNETIRNVFVTILKGLQLITPESIVNVDFSTFAGGWSHPEFQVLTFGVQTYIGRAIPIFFDIIRYPIEYAGSQNIFIIEAIKKFKNIFDFYPVFVFDRGFAIPSLITFLVNEGIVFYVRSKSGKTVRIISMKSFKDMVEVDRLVKAHQIKEKDTTVKVYGKPMRLVISDKDGKDKEPWYILTSDFSSPRKKILETYYFRFEIEETFKDLKHLRNLEHIQVKTEKSFRTTLWFMILGCWLAYFIQIIQEKTKQTVTTIHQSIRINSHKTLSFFRTFFESIQRCFYFIHAYLTRKSRFR